MAFLKGTSLEFSMEHPIDLIHDAEFFSQTDGNVYLNPTYCYNIAQIDGSFEPKLIWTAPGEVLTVHDMLPKSDHEIKAHLDKNMRELEQMLQKDYHSTDPANSRRVTLGILKLASIFKITLKDPDAFGTHLNAKVDIDTSSFLDYAVKGVTGSVFHNTVLQQLLRLRPLTITSTTLDTFDITVDLLTTTASRQFALLARGILSGKSIAVINRVYFHPHASISPALAYLLSNPDFVKIEDNTLDLDGKELQEYREIIEKKWKAVSFNEMPEYLIPYNNEL